MGRLERRRVEGVEAAQLDLVALRASLPSGSSLRSTTSGRPADREELARAHRLEQVAHHEVGSRLDVGGRNSDLRLDLLDERARVRLDREPDHKQLTEVLHVRLARGLVDQLLAHRPVLWAEDDRDRRVVMFERRLCGERQRLDGWANVAKA